MTAEAAGVFLDYSKNRITEETVKLLIQLAEESGLRQRVESMFRGDMINVTKKRAVLHVALRAASGTSILVDGENVVPQVHAVLDRVSDFSNRVRRGEWKGHTGKRIKSAKWANSDEITRGLQSESCQQQRSGGDAILAG